MSKSIFLIDADAIGTDAILKVCEYVREHKNITAYFAHNQNNQTTTSILSQVCSERIRKLGCPNYKQSADMGLSFMLGAELATNMQNIDTVKLFSNDKTLKRNVRWLCNINKLEFSHSYISAITKQSITFH
ncbi:hypothetical protein A6E01_19480 (plasmid) [Vibrio breoganii]|uniref:Uncharacterized protein n=1 Tax=Vibrio breoganii TaxID=553239 RepID=A0AAN0XZ45_9VIBR|nr:hypothetical protein [Vibrio breoganii]ANO35397.1 hypothetical protein A6E01_19480 [Vibrio breoganii]PML12678.1 hypothetical protein BCT84_02010 [Vibrio breoganii]